MNYKRIRTNKISTMFEGTRIDKLFQKYTESIEIDLTRSILEEASDIGCVISEAVLKEFPKFPEGYDIDDLPSENGYIPFNVDHLSDDNVRFIKCCEKYFHESEFALNAEDNGFAKLDAYGRYRKELLQAVNDIWDVHIDKNPYNKIGL